jgi:hypothetical protein
MLLKDLTPNRFFHAAHPLAVQLNRMRLLTVMLEAGGRKSHLPPPC